MKTINCFLCLMLVLVSCSQPKTTYEVSVIPRPDSIVVRNGAFILSDKTIIVAGEEVKNEAEYLNDFLKKATGYDIPVVAEGKKNALILKLDKNLPGLQGSEEGYLLKSTLKNVTITGTTAAGLFNGIQTLRQLLPSEIESQAVVSNVEWAIPVVEIKDQPAFPWRGVMLDCSRHFFPVAHIKNLLDQLAAHKMNRFHWHLIDDQGWRLEVKKYPELTATSAWRVDREDLHWKNRPPMKPGEKATYGGFYTQEEIREIVNYATKLHIEVIPEIEMPAHISCVFAAYPQYSCSGKKMNVLPGGVWPITDIYCAGNDEVFAFLEDVLTEVIDLFPSKYIHIGGDEATKTNWEKCPKCRARIKSEGLADTKELQSYFIKRMEKFLNSRGRNLIGWDEILEGGLAPQATVMSWRGFEGGIEAARSGHDVIMTPTAFCYFDYYQGPGETEPLAIGGYLPLSKVYDYQPVLDSLTAEEAKHILGGQANVWTEYISTPEHCFYMLLPRLSALTEVLWTQKDNRNYQDFLKRLNRQFKRYDFAGVNYARKIN